MRVSLRWLSEYITLPTDDPDAIKRALEDLGHEVDGVEQVPVGWTDVVIAEVVSVEPHPNADKVRLCQVVIDGDRTPIDVVCGAWNFDVGAIVAFAKPGAVLPGDFQIGSREIRGVKSNGMICSEKELDLGEGYEGILVLDSDAPVGVDFGDYVELPDVIFDVSLTPNRPDAMSMWGIARELSAYFGVPYSMPDPVLDARPGVPAASVTIEDPSGCLRFTGREIQGVEIGPSPFWMRQRLRSAGVRAISNAVDVTNYVMLEMGHPLHAFDADRIIGKQLTVRRASAGEKITTLDDVERTMTSDDLVICDASGPTSLAGTMGGATSEVADDTTTVFLEAASWDPPTIMWMSRRHGLRSEASARFERGVDPNLPLLASARATQLLCDMTGAMVLESVIDVVAVPVVPAEIELSVSDVTRILGEGFSAEKIAGHLRSIEMVVTEGDPMTVTVPTFRPDLGRPIDLVEEVARLHGFDNFDETVPRGSSGGLTRAQRNERTIRSALVGAGLSQAVHLSFIGAGDLEAFAFPDGHEARQVVRVNNPLREEEGLLRTTLLPALLDSLRYNASYGAASGGLFETGRVFFDRLDPRFEWLPHQPERLGFALFGVSGGLELGGVGRKVDAFTATALAELLAASLDITDMTVVAASEPGFHPGRCAQVLIGGESAGYIGEVHPATAAAYDLPGRVAVGELDIALLTGESELHQLLTPSTYPPSEFDLAFVVADDLASKALLDVTAMAGGELVESVSLFDEYRDLGGGKKSLALRYVLRAPDRTLTNEEIGPIRDAMITAAGELGGELRGAG